LDEGSSLGTASKRGCFFRNARARHAHVEATSSHSFAAQALAELLADVDLYHCDDGLLSRGALARTCERPQGWNGATGQWEHFAHPDGNVAALARLLELAEPDELAFGAPVALGDVGARDAVIFAVPRDAAARALGRKLPAGPATVPRAATFLEGAGPAGERDLGGGVLLAPAAGGAVAHAPGDAAPGDVAARARAACPGLAPAPRRWTFELAAPPDGPPPEPPFLDLGGGVFVCGDWCAGGGSVDRALVSGSSCARRVAELLSGEVDAPPS